MTKYTPFELKGDVYSVCPTCDVEGDIKKALTKQEERKMTITQKYIHKHFQEVLCPGHEKDAEKISWDQVEAILDECQEVRKPKESFVIEDWMVQSLRDKNAILPGIDPRTS